MWGLKGLIYERRFRSEVLDVYLKGRPFLIIEILGSADMYVKKKGKQENLFTVRSTIPYGIVSHRSWWKNRVIFIRSDQTPDPRATLHFHTMDHYDQPGLFLSWNYLS